MAKNEDYLDKLLNSVNGKSGKPLNDGVGYLESEEDFINDFERELENEGQDDILSSFEEELNRMEAESPRTATPVMEEEDDQRQEEPAEDDYLSNIESLVNESHEQVGSEPEEEDDLQIDTISDPFTESVEDKVEEIEEPDTIAEEENQEEDDESKGLMELLSEISDEDEELSDIGKMLKADDEKLDIEEPEMDELSDDLDLSEGLEVVGEEEIELEEKKGKKKKKESKRKKKDKTEVGEEGEKSGFFAKLGLLLFGEEEKELTPEEQEARKAEEKLAKAEKKAEKEQKKQEKKALKEQKAKEKQEQKDKQPKKEKKPKEPKEKKPKEVDNTPPLPKVPVVLISVMAASLAVLIFLGTNVLGYASVISQAKDSYKNKDYLSAFTTLNGTTVKEKDMELYQKSALMSYLQSEYDGYNTYMSINDYEGALDCLIRGIGRYDLHIGEAEEYGIEQEYNELETSIEQALKDQFNVKADKARELYSIKKRREYTQEIKTILKKLGLE